MRFLQPFNNYVSRIELNGDLLMLDVVLIDRNGDPIKPEYVDPDAPETTHVLNMTWYLTNKETGQTTSYTLESGITVVNNDYGHVRLTIPAGEVKSNRGFDHRLLGYYDENSHNNHVLATGRIDTITPGIENFSL